MSVFTLPTPLSNNLPTIPSLLLLTPFLLIPITLIFTFIFTTLRYHIALNSSQNNASPQIPPHLPYTLPFLGSALSFIAPNPGRFWDGVRSKIPSSLHACTILLGGRTTHVIFSPLAVQGLFKAKSVTRHAFDIQVVGKGFGMSDSDCLKLFGPGAEKTNTGAQERKRDSKPKVDGDKPEISDPKRLSEAINNDYLLTQSAVNELTAKFIESFRDLLASQSKDQIDVDLFGWLKQQMFIASTTAFMGSRLVEMYPNLGSDFFTFDAEFLALFFGIPKFFKPDVYKSRERLLNQFTRWVQEGREQCGGIIPDENTIPWEPLFGSRIVRVRQKLYDQLGISTRGRASVDLGFLFGLASNAIPASGWMLFHILSPQSPSTPSLLPRVLAELETARLPDGTLDIPTLISLPLLQSIFQETLRIYVDVLVTRDITEDLVVDSHNSLSSSEPTKLFLKKNNIVMAPSWFGHRDPQTWTQPPFNEFDPERFLKEDPVTGNPVFSTAGTAGKLFPFGGGKNICPGRVFAKQEVLASVAMVLLGFDFEVLKFVGTDGGKERRDFPGLRKAYTGNGVMAMDGDLRVRIRRRVREMI